MEVFVSMWSMLLKFRDVSYKHPVSAGVRVFLNGYTWTHLFGSFNTDLTSHCIAAFQSKLEVGISLLTFPTSDLWMFQVHNATD